MSPVGRRPGNADTRGAIIEAAKRVFAENGYDRTSLRAVARAAGVDPALVHHYFDGKADLFVSTMALPFDPRSVHDRAEKTARNGASVVEAFLTMWDRADDAGSAFASHVAAMAASHSVADATREFVRDRVWRLDAADGEDEALTQRRTALVSSQLMGLAFTRYILRVPPVSTATPRQIARWVGPTIDRYANEPIG